MNVKDEYVYRLTPIMSTTVDDQRAQVIEFQAARRRRRVVWYGTVGPVSNDRSEARTTTVVLLVSVLVHNVGHGQLGELLSVFELTRKRDKHKIRFLISYIYARDLHNYFQKEKNIISYNH